MFDLKGKVGLVTGAATGIGFAYVKELLRNESKGVALIDIDGAKGQQALNEVNKEFGNNRAIFVKADLSDKIQFEEAFKVTVKTFGNLDIVINNAGILQELQWEKCIAVNLVGVITGSFLAMETYLPQYRSGSETVLVNISSAAGLQPTYFHPTYVATKSGVIGFSRSLGSDEHYQRCQVKVLVLCPCITDTSFLELTTEQVDQPRPFKIKPEQKPENVAKLTMGLIREARNGSVWIIAKNNCTEVEFPKYEDCL